ncbi:MAG: hypothetical protein H0V48_05235 [Nocardioidaceae bacterium]|jgi:hypothetical protein|nr:hypothetical protein [Nocardioidaceae bacterium]
MPGQPPAEQADRSGEQTMAKADELDTEKVLSTLQDALQLQARSILTMTTLAGTLRGLPGTAVKQQLREYVLAELEDTYRLMEKHSAIGGELTLDVPTINVAHDPESSINDLIDLERETVAALHAVIEFSGQEPRSEALEHLLEHLIMRKQQQIDFLWHASSRTEPLS